MIYLLLAVACLKVGFLAGIRWRDWSEEKREEQRRIDRIWLGVRTSIVTDRFIKIRDPEDFVRIVDHPAHPWKQN